MSIDKLYEDHQLLIFLIKYKENLLDDWLLFICITIKLNSCAVLEVYLITN